MRRLTWYGIGIVCLVTLGGLAGARDGAGDAAERAGAAEGDPALAGLWSGAIELPNRGIEIHVALERANGTWSGRIDVPPQAIRKVDLAGLAVDGKQATFRIPGVPGDPTFAGVLQDDGDTIAGTFTQGGQSIPFRLERAAEPADYDADLYADYTKPGRKGEGAAGHWVGVLAAGPHRYRMKLDIETGEDGARATLTSVDQGAASLPTDGLTVEDGATVRFRIDRIGVAYEGTLSDDGREIGGTWTQGGQSLPLTFRRAE